MTKYLCGCDVAAKENYRAEFDSNGRLVVPMIGAVRICPEHGDKIEGWRTAEALRTGRLTKAGGV